jgi:transcriptional regulator with XRE-family HTH domain
VPPRTQARSPESDPAALLGDELRELRKQAGHRSQDDVAAVIGTDRSVIGKAETGELPPTPDLLKALLDAYQVTGRLRRVYERLNAVARARQDPGRLHVAPWYETEARAHTLRYWAPTIVPGIAQTAAYAADLFRALGHDEATITDLVRARTSRQTILTRPEPPDTTILLWEPVLHHQIGTPDTMREQLATLIGLSARIMIQIVPGDIGANAGVGGPIGLAATDDAPELLVSSALVEDHLTNNPVPVRKASATFNRVRGDALTVQQSRARLTEAMERWQGQPPAGASPVTA